MEGVLEQTYSQFEQAGPKEKRPLALKFLNFKPAEFIGKITPTRHVEMLSEIYQFCLANKILQQPS